MLYYIYERASSSIAMLMQDSCRVTGFVQDGDIGYEDISLQGKLDGVRSLFLLEERDVFSVPPGVSLCL